MAQVVVGVMFDGFPLYGPLDGRGRPHADLDECNGKYDAHGDYGYYATSTAPYTISCWGPGALADTRAADESARRREAPGEPDCPVGSFPQAAAPRARSLQQRDDTPASLRCVLCPPGRYALLSRDGSLLDGSTHGPRGATHVLSALRV